MTENTPLHPSCRALVAVLAALVLTVQAALPASAEKPVYPEWQKPRRCVFGMPYVNGVVEPNEKGVITAILKEVFDRRDMTFEHRSLPYNRVRPELRKGSIQCSLGLRGHHGMEVEGETAIAVFNLAVAYRTRDGFQGVDAMAGERVACIYGFDFQKLLPVEVLVRNGFDLTSSFHLLDRGDVRYVLDEETQMREALFETKLPTSEIGIKRIMTLEVHPIFSPDEAGREFKALYDRRMRNLAEDGKLRRIMRDNGMPEQGIDTIFKINGY